MWLDFLQHFVFVIPVLHDNFVPFVDIFIVAPLAFLVPLEGNFTPKDFLFNLGRFDRPCRIFDTMAHLDLQAANIDGEREFVQSHVVTWSNISKIAPSYSLDVVRPRLTNFFFNYFLVPFIGSIPESFGQLGNLVELDLSNNKLEGQFFFYFLGGQCRLTT